MKAVTLHYVIPGQALLYEEHRCGENAGYECPETTRSTYDVKDAKDDWPLIHIWGDQGTFWAPEFNQPLLSG